MKIGNILVSNVMLDATKDFNIIKNEEDIIKNQPTLIIGWDYIKKNYKNYSIINRVLDNGYYWTFSNREKREIHDKDLYDFIKKAYTKTIQETQYIYIDPIIQTKKKTLKIIRYIYKSDNVITYIHDDMIYININNLIFGVNLSIINFIGFDTEKLIKNIKKISNIILYKNDIFIEYKKAVEILDNQVKYVPFLYSKRHE